MQRRAAIVFATYVVVVLVHLVLIAAGASAARETKWLLMPVLLAAALVVAARPEPPFATRPEPPSAPAAARPDPLWAGPPRRGLALLAGAILASWAGDVLLGVSFVVGLAAFAVAHLAYLATFLGPARTRRPSRWAAAGYLVWVAVLLPVLWPDLGSLAVVVALYAVVLAATASASTGVNAVTAWGGLLFLASDSLLAFRIFRPGFGDLFPDPWQDLTIMALYCAGQGLMAFGVLRRLRLGATDRDRALVGP